MGTRVHKVIGYGLSDVKLKKSRCVDPRINIDNLRDDKTKEEFIEFLNKKTLDKKQIDLNFIKRDLETCVWSPYSSYHYNFEYNDKVIVFTMPTYKDWVRYDNVIDHYECPFPKSKVKKLKWGIYPFIAQYMRKSTGIEIKEDEFYKIHHIVQSIGGMHNLSYDDLQEVGFSSKEEFLEEIVPSIPIGIRCFCEFMEVFVDNKTINHLKPMIYTYWS